MSKTNPDKAYRPNAGITLFNRDGKVFVARRNDLPKIPQLDTLPHPWQMPQGGIDANEDPLVAAKRELFEETSVKSTRLLATAPQWLTYDFPPEIAGQLLKGNYAGQKQMWYAMLFTGDDDEINILTPGDGRHKAEFCEWRWEDLEKTPDLIVPFKRHIYVQLVDWFGELANTIPKQNA